MHILLGGLLVSLKAIHNYSILLYFKRCAIPWYKNDSFKVQNEDHQLLINRYIPESFNNQYAYEPCSAFTDDDNNSQSTNDTASCSHWVYDKTDFEETFITQVKKMEIQKSRI